jgi:predicted DNA-binding transcriptional regulator AlpA
MHGRRAAMAPNPNHREALMRFQIREQEKQIPRRHVADFVKISRSTLWRKVKSGDLPGPENLKGYSRQEVENLLPGSSGRFSGNATRKKRRYYEDLKTCGFESVDGGVFLFDRKTCKNPRSVFSKMIKTYGLWDAQGLSNHVHLDHLARNPIDQIYLAQDIMDTWTECLKQGPADGDYVIYWNGLVDSTLCVYSRENVGDEFLEKFDQHLRIKKCFINEWEV